MISKRLAAFVITYERPTQLRATLEAVLGQTVRPETVVVIDNGDPAITAEVLCEVGHPIVEHRPTGENLGPAGATAIGLRVLADRGYEWIYWIDDDDPPIGSDIVARLLRLADDSDPANLGAVGVAGSRFDWNRGTLRRLPDSELECEVCQVDVIAGNQQLIIARRVIDAVGVADARLFFGHYEPEYCLRIRRAGYRLLVNGPLMREHRERFGRTGLGSRARLDLIPRYPLHQIWQRYYRTRNYIYFMRRTFGRPDLARREAVKALVRCSTACLRGPSYAYRFAQLQLRGIVDGYRDRLGRTIAPSAKY